ncbi:MAG: copper chaperone PCu(A)C [Cupriavidus sp.]|nr:MAG: copper chaperone PCu(A)C [Cupriavidus sp.]
MPVAEFAGPLRHSGIVATASMRMRMRRVLAFSMALLFTGACIAGKPGMRVENAWTRAVPAVAPVAGGFLTVVNDGGSADRLLRIETDAAQRVEIHQMRNDGGVMRMRALPDGVTVPAHGRVEFKPGGYHLMLIQPKRALAEGGRFDATLVFQRAGRVKATFEVRGMGAGG